MSPKFVLRKKCPACRSTEFHTLFQCNFTDNPIRAYLEEFYGSQGFIDMEAIAGGVFKLDECASCGLVYQEEILGDSLMEELYERWIDPEKILHLDNETKGLSKFAGYAQEIMQIISLFDTLPSKLTFLDYGMGWGRWAMMARAFGCQCFGVELSKKRIDFAKANGVSTISINDPPAPRFDFVNTEQVFEHLPDPLDTLISLKASLKPHGVVKISVPNGNGIKKKLITMAWKAPKPGANTNPVSPLEHINCYSRESIIRMGAVAGMKETILPMSNQYRYTTNWTSANQVLKNSLRPIYRNVLKGGTYVLLTPS